MPAPAAVGALVGVAGRLVGKKGAQAAAGAAAKEVAEEGSKKLIAGLGMVQANQQQAQQKKQNMQQRLQDATREGASTGSTIGKGEFFHPSVGGYIEQREGRRGPVTIMARGEGEVETPVPQTEMKRGQPMVQQMELGALPDGFFSEHAHERLTDRRRTVDENESQQVQQRISQIVRQHTDSTGMYRRDSPREFAVRTHIFDDHRQPDETLSMSNGDSIVGIVRPNPKNRNFPSLHTVMLRRSELSHAPQPFKPAELRVNRVFNNHGMSNSELRRKAKMNKSEAMDITWRLLKERKSPEAMRHKREYDKKYESSPERVKYREDLNRERRRRGIYGSGDHMDVSHTEGGGLTLESQHANRGRHFKDKGTLRVVKARDVRDFTEQYPDLQFRQTDVLEDPLETYGLSTTPREPMLSSNKFSTQLTPTSDFANPQFRTMDPARVAILQRFADRSRVKRPVKIEQTVGMGENADFGPHSNLSDMSSLYDDYFLESANYAQPPYSDEEIQAYREQFPKTRFDDRMTMQDIRNFKKSLSEDLELLRNLLAGPMDEQDKKIGLAMVGMLEERHENDDDDEEEEKFKHKYHGGFL